ncbi:unnamed protein product [Pseudo-nitzschia multistriata]|uniref:Uncharacterized protein n=1 Tax=Pseudo-nitzschia multistriata TaxID=183589 RepID=A0A448ZNK0_9STRA|nr:unnamed protein product [Pseudo-nitzschia multistriata]
MHLASMIWPISRGYASHGMAFLFFSGLKSALHIFTRTVAISNTFGHTQASITFFFPRAVTIPKAKKLKFTQVLRIARANGRIYLLEFSQTICYQPFLALIFPIRNVFTNRAQDLCDDGCRLINIIGIT